MKKTVFLSALVFCTLLSFSAHADDVFEKYFFKVNGECSEPENMSFRKLELVYAEEIDIDEDGNYIYPWAGISLFKNGTFVLSFIEYWVEDVEGGLIGHVTFQKNYPGSWTRATNTSDRLLHLILEDGTELPLYEVGDSDNPWSELPLTIPANFERARNKELFSLFAPSTSTSGAWLETAEEFCKDPY